ncbi:MAG: hypothetical protein MJK11_14505 [Pseudomonadales bacterium]|nr:hypothetical protein [Pseudomonadales bacterium]
MIGKPHKEFTYNIPNCNLVPTFYSTVHSIKFSTQYIQLNKKSLNLNTQTH